MARDEKLIYKIPVVIPLGSTERPLGDQPHCRPGTIPGPPNGEGDCSRGTYAHSQQQAGCFDGISATSGGGEIVACQVGTSPSLKL